MRERPAANGRGPADATVALTFDGEPIRARPGQTIAGALIAAGHSSWRATRHRDEPRGLFCGIGVCFDCLVTLNDMRSVRACLVDVRDGDVVTSERATGYDELAV